MVLITNWPIMFVIDLFARQCFTGHKVPVPFIVNRDPHQPVSRLASCWTSWASRFTILV